MNPEYRRKITKSMAVCVIGGAGYIGSVTVEILVSAGYEVVVYDNLSRGHRKAVAPEAHFVKGDHGDKALLEETLKRYGCTAVMHFSALSLVAESVENPLLYYENNVAKAIALLQAAVSAKVRHFIFSSTAAVYGNPESIPIRENDPTNPANPYGNTKLAFERLLWDAGIASGFRSISLRYFNAAGASDKFGEDHKPETHLIPVVLQVALGKSPFVSVFGNACPTKDGSCIRDFIHVLDLAQAHLLALKYLEAGGKSDVFNLGNGKGFSVLEVITEASRVTQKEIPYKISEPRKGDPAILVASSEKIQKILGWSPRFPQLESIIQTAWKWHLAHPDGYKSS